MESALFSVVVIHYKQPEFYKEALDSVFMQDYQNIEMVFADDCSGNLDMGEVEEYIDLHSGENITGRQVFTNDSNLGTVKNLNKALKRANGKYILFFAADDRLADEKVISSFVKALEENKESGLKPVCARSIMMDHELSEVIKEFVDDASKKAVTSAEQHRLMLNKCCYAVGATAFEREEFIGFGGFDESYKVIEDWSFFLEFTKKGGAIYYKDFAGLKHRAGGISENGKEQKLLGVYRDDLINIYKKEVLPYLSEERDIHARAEMLVRFKNTTGEKGIFLKFLLVNPRIFWYLVKGKLLRKKLF